MAAHPTSSRVWRNWSGRVECRPAKFAEPKSLEELQAVVRDAAAGGKKVRVVGSGHSFTELVATDDTLITLDGLQGLVEAKPEAGEATVWAGTKLHLLNPMLDENGLAMENLGDINVQSIAGAVSTGTHGTGIKFGNIATQVIGLTLVTASGEVLEISETQNRELFKAAQVSIGALGVIAKVKLRLVPSYRLEYRRERSTFGETLRRAEEWRDAHRQFEFYCFPYADGVQLKFLDQTDKPVDVNLRAKWFADVFLENMMFGAMSVACRTFPSMCAPIARFCASTVAASREVNVGHKTLSTVRNVKFNEMEFAMPAENGLAAIRELKEWIDREKITVHFPIEFRYVKGDDVCISPHHGRDSAAISVHQFVGMDYKKYFDGAEAIFRKHSGRPHWGKLHSLTAKELRPLYPKWSEFQRAREQLDPKGVFMTPYLRRLFVE
jgi:FAD-linked oxidoreductase